MAQRGSRFGTSIIPRKGFFIALRHGLASPQIHGSEIFCILLQYTTRGEVVKSLRAWYHVSGKVLTRRLQKPIMEEGPWVNHDGETDVVFPYPEVIDGYALPLDGPGLGITFDEVLGRSRPFKPRLQPRLNAPDGSAHDF